MQSVAVHASCQIHKLLNKRMKFQKSKPEIKHPRTFGYMKLLKELLITKRFWEMEKDICSQNKYLVLVYDKIYARDSCLPYNNKV